MNKTENLKLLSHEISFMWGLDLEKSDISLRNRTAVIIDALAATSNLSALLGSGIQDLYLATSDTLLEIRAQFPAAFIIGESRNPELKDIFHFSNVPSELHQPEVFRKLKNATGIFLTTNGTHTINEALKRQASTVITASYNNIYAVVDFLNQRRQSITIIPAGERTFTESKTREDQLCAEMLIDLLLNYDVSWSDTKMDITEWVRINYAIDYLSSGRTMETLRDDLKLILSVDKYRIVPQCQYTETGIIKVTRAPFKMHTTKK